MVQEILLIAVAVVLIFALMSARKSQSDSKTWDCIDRNSGELATVSMQVGAPAASAAPAAPTAPATPEKAAQSENAEYFSGPQGADTQSCDDKFEFAVNEFGGPGMDFKDWVAAQSVDPQVMKNHTEFVKDRLGSNTQNITGRTYSPDSHDSFDPIPWVGLRRPQAVAVGNPDQVPDIDRSLYENKPKFTWSSS